MSDSSRGERAFGWGAVMSVNEGIIVKKLAAGAALGFGMLLATAAPAAAEGYVYTGHWYKTAAACEKAWDDAHSGGPSLGHQCRNTGPGVYELWAYQL